MQKRETVRAQLVGDMIEIVATGISGEAKCKVVMSIEAAEALANDIIDIASAKELADLAECPLAKVM